MSQILTAQARPGLHLETQASSAVVVDAASDQHWTLTPLEARVWACLGRPLSATAMASAVSTNDEVVSAAQLWAALDALADRGLLMQRAAPPTAEAVSSHQALGRRQWAMAGLAMAAAPMAFAASAAVSEEKAKLEAADTQDAQAREQNKKRQEQDMKLKKTSQEENQKSVEQRRVAEETRKQQQQDLAGKRQEQEEKARGRAEEQKVKQLESAQQRQAEEAAKKAPQ